jgi:bifunctional DNA-binding transcriptional regulator/antitoxin component of YhaV-PrlF toxin-antitoxin module
MSSQICRLTERGQVSMPAALRRKMHLKAGQLLRWESVSDTEVRIVVEATEPDPLRALGYGSRFRKGKAHATSQWMKELRAGE